MCYFLASIMETNPLLSLAVDLVRFLFLFKPILLTTSNIVFGTSFDSLFIVHSDIRICCLNTTNSPCHKSSSRLSDA